MDKTVRPIPKPQKPRHFVREWRKHRNLTQEQLAERIGKTHGAISQLERGLIDYTQGMLEALAYALSCEPGDLLQINPLMAGEVVDISSLLRGAPAPVRQQAYAIVQALVQGAPEPMTLYRPDADMEERPLNVGRPTRDKERQKARRE